MKLYGNVSNRFEENKMFCEEIKVGTGMTEYLYSDRNAYEVIAVKDQKHVTVREYDVKHIGEPMTNHWELISNKDNPKFNMEKRGKYWYKAVEVKSDILRNDDIFTKLWLINNGIDIEVLKAKGKVKKLHRMDVSFGIADYYYDYEF